jgi:hypothetical protein
VARGLTHPRVATRTRRVAASAARGVDVPEAPLTVLGLAVVVLAHATVLASQVTPLDVLRPSNWVFHPAETSAVQQDPG